MADSEQRNLWASSYRPQFVALYTFPLQPSIAFVKSMDRVWIEHRKRPPALTLICCWLMPLVCGALIRYVAPGMITAPKALNVVLALRDWAIPGSVVLAAACTVGAFVQQRYFRRKGAIVEMSRSSGLIVGRRMPRTVHRSEVLACQVALGFTSRKVWTEAQFLVAAELRSDGAASSPEGHQALLVGAWNGSGSEVVKAFRQFSEEITVEFRVVRINRRWSMERVV